MNTQERAQGHGLLAVTVLVYLGHCGTESSLPPPVVQAFWATPSFVTLGDSTLLSWSVAGADSVYLSPDIGLVTGQTAWVHPSSSTTYRLVATNKGGADTAFLSVAVTLPPPPQIVAFDASSGAIVDGATSVLSWSTIGADTVRIDQGIGPVHGTLLQVQPTSSTTYTLTAVNVGGAVTASVSVNVNSPSSPPPDPPMFVARMIGGGGILLSWSVVPQASSYAIEWSSNISPTFVALTSVSGSTYYVDGGPVTANNIYTYRLKALNALGESPGVTASTLAAPPPPEGPMPILISPASPVTVGRGGIVTFAADQVVTWIVLDGPAGGTITSAGVYTAPAGPGTYRIAAVGSVTNTATVIVP